MINFLIFLLLHDCLWYLHFCWNMLQDSDQGSLNGYAMSTFCARNNAYKGNLVGNVAVKWQLSDLHTIVVPFFYWALRLWFRHIPLLTSLFVCLIVCVPSRLYDISDDSSGLFYSSQSSTICACDYLGLSFLYCPVFTRFVFCASLVGWMIVDAFASNDICWIDAYVSIYPPA